MKNPRVPPLFEGIFENEFSKCPQKPANVYVFQRRQKTQMNENANPDYEKLQKALNQFSKMSPNYKEKHTKSRILKTG